MILTDKFVEEVQVLDKLTDETYEKVINFSISYIAKHDTQTTLAEVLEIEEQDAQKLFLLALKLVSFFGKFRFGDREFKQNIDFLKLSASKKQYFLSKLESQWQELHKKLSFIESDGMAYFKKLDWRYDLQISSRTNEDELIPRIIMNFQLENEKGETDNILLESDYANVKNLHEELTYLVKLHDSARQQKIKKLGQLL